MSKPATLLLFDLYTGGHHRQYIEMLGRAWVEGPDRGRMTIAVPQLLLDDHPDFTAWMMAQDPERLGTIPLSVSPPLAEGSLGLGTVLSNDLRHGRILSALIREQSPRNVLAMYFDHIQASLALRRIRGTRVSGIYFRPSFHYSDEPMGRGLRKRALLAAALRNPRVHRVLTLDPFAVEALADPRVVWLPDGFDPVPPARTPASVRDDWGVEPGRQVLLFFGVVSARKGIHEVLRAMGHVPRPETTALVIVGRVPREEVEEVNHALERAQESGPAQIIHIPGYLPDDRIQDAFRAADVALAAYQNHVGSSNILIRAAAEAVPVVGPRYGLMGQMIERHRLGVAVRTGDSRRLAAGIDEALTGRSGMDPRAARAFAASNTAAMFADTVFREVLA